MEKSASDTATPAKPAESQSAGWLRVLAYPVSVISGLWMVNRDVHHSTYLNLKRYKTFNDILKQGEGGGLERLNESNVQRRIMGADTVEKFLENSHGTKTAYNNAVTERMAHMGLGEGCTNFIKKWNYVDRTGKIDALLRGATVTGIVAVVMLTLADSKPLLKMMGFSKDDDHAR